MDPWCGERYDSMNRMNEMVHVIPDHGFNNGELEQNYTNYDSMVNFKSIEFEQNYTSYNSTVNVNNTEFEQNYTSFPVLPLDPGQGIGLGSHLEPMSSMRNEGDSHEDYDFNDVVLNFISDMLMEEDMEEKNCMFPESAALQAAEKSLYEVIGETYPPPRPPPSNYGLMTSVDQNFCNPNENCSGICGICSCSRCLTSNIVDQQCNIELGEFRFHQTTSINSSNSGGTSFDSLEDSPVSILGLHDVLCESEYAVQFQKGVEETSRLRPVGCNLVADMKTDGSSDNESEEDSGNGNKKIENGYCSRGKKNSHSEDVYLEDGRSNKQSAVYNETTVSSKMFDEVLLCGVGARESALREELQREANSKMQQSAQLKGSNGRKARGKKKRGKGNTVDLRTLLTLCAEAVAANDQRSSIELLKQIRQHSSSTGEGMQRMAHYFANGLEARIAGSGTEIYKAFITSRVKAADILKSYHLFLAVCPFRKLSNFFSNKTIMQLTENKTRVHVIDFGILYGFQYPSLIQRLSDRLGGPPKLRITGIDFPQPGFKPAERVEETGHRLADYAKKFNVPFEFNAIAKKWETIQIEDLKIDEDDEVLVVNCVHRMRNLLDETVIVDCPRDVVLNLIRKINPDVFIQGIVNGVYSAPFFITRFRQALFHFSSLFDMIESVIPRDKPERLLIEKEMFGREAMNVVACEGCERIERPETYKQSQVRNLRIGFRQLPLNKEVMEKAKDRVKSCYHKDFVIDEDSNWMLLGWKGRICHAMSCWKASN